MIQFFVPGKPVPKGRARIVRRNGKVMAFTPDATVNFELHVKFMAASAMNNAPPIDGPLHMDMLICLLPPASWSQKKQDDAITGHVWPTVKPDSSNVLKAIEDALNGIVYRDDSQLCSHSIRKCYSQRPGVQVTVEQLSGTAAR